MCFVGSYLVFVLEEVVDGFNEDPVELWMKAIQAAVHANTDVRSINASHQRRYTYLTVTCKHIFTEHPV